MVTQDTKPIETIIIQRLNNAGSPSSTIIVKIPPTMEEHHIIFELLKRLRHDYPGAWACALQWEREQLHGPITVPMLRERYKGQLDEPFAGIKEVTREHLGLPAEDIIGDVPV